MTNPNNAVGTNAAYSGRTSPNALNDILASFTKGIVSGWECSPKTGMTIQVGGTANARDVALAEDNAGNKITINNRSGAPIEITLDGAPSTNNRIDAIVAYVDNPSTGDGNTTDNPTACGIIAVKGSVAANPTAPSEATIRAAITTDGATGGSAYYVILATILVGTNVTTIGSGVITQGDASKTNKITVENGSIVTQMIAALAVTFQKIDWGGMTDGATWLKIGNLLIQFGDYDFGSQSFNNNFWGSMARASGQFNYITWPIEFGNAPYFVGIFPLGTAQVATTNAAGTKTDSKTRSRDFTVVAPSNYTSTADVKGYWIAIGPAA